jgi:DNA-binding response OmpR family regulator
MNDLVPTLSVSETIKPTILIAEDDVDLMDFLDKELKNSFTILKALDGEKALEIVLKENIQLVVSDVKMPKMDGFDLCKSIKNNTDTCHIPIILLTSKTGSKSKIKGLQSKADVYIPKPFSVDLLILQINTLLENRKQTLQYYLSSPLSHLKANSNTQIDAEFLQALDEAMSNNIADPDLSIETLAEIMNMSRSTFYRKIKDLSDLSPNDLINRARLKKAAELLHTGKYKIFEVAEMVGYKSQTNFGRNFQKFYKMTPTEYIQNSKGK